MVKFNRELQKKTQIESIADNDFNDTQGIEIRSPSRMHWFQIYGESFEKLIQVETCRLFDPDGEEVEYVIQAPDPSLKYRIHEKADNDVSTKLILRCCNWFGTEFLWLPTIKPKGGSKVGAQSAKAAIQKGLKGWIKCKWAGNNIGWATKIYPSETDKIPQWSAMSEEEIIDQVFDGRIIESLDHEALVRNAGGKV